MNVLDEYFDVLDETGSTTGQSKKRNDVHRDGDWHRSFHLWIVNSDGYVLLQRRSKHKDLEPNKVDVTVGGHYRAGETLADVVREVEEEIGLFVRPEALHFLATKKAERFYDGKTDREFQDIYVLKHDQPLGHYFLDCNEVSILYELSLDKAIALFEKGKFAAAAGYDCQQRINNALLTETDLIEQAKALTAKTLQQVKDWLEQFQTAS